jgi:hypothetical protein
MKYLEILFLSKLKSCYSEKEIECCPGHARKGSEACCEKIKPKPPPFVYTTPTKAPTTVKATLVVLTTNAENKILPETTSISNNENKPNELPINSRINLVTSKTSWWVWLIV